MEFFEQILQEASKERFIRPLYDAENDLIFADDKINDFVEDQKKGDFCNALIKWVDSGAADRLKFNWQSKDKLQLWSDLVIGYYNYINAGGSLKDRRIRARQNPEELFKENLITIYEGEDATDADVLILKSLENSKFIFIIPITYEAFKFIDSSACGGQGAKWCLGYSQDNRYFNDYIKKDGNLFVLAFSKNPNPRDNELKFMIQINPDNIKNTKVWNQRDDQDDTIPADDISKFFDCDINDFIAAYQTCIFKYNTAYSVKAIGNWTDEESIGTVNENYFFSDDDLIDKTYYCYDFRRYTKEDLRKKVNGKTILVDCQKLGVGGDWLHASPKGEGDPRDVDLANFINYLKDNEVTCELITFKNGFFGTVIWEPEACDVDKCPDIHFEHCTISELIYKDLSGNRNEYYPSITISGDSKLRHITWGTSQKNSNKINKAGLVILGEQEPEESWVEQDKEQYMESIKLNEWDPSTKSEALDWVENELNAIKDKLDELNSANLIQYEDYSTLFDMVDKALDYTAKGIKLEESKVYKFNEELASSDEIHYYNEGYDAYMEKADETSCPYDKEPEKEYQKYYNSLKSKAWHWGFNSARKDDENNEAYESRMRESEDVREHTGFISNEDFNKLKELIEQENPDITADYARQLAINYNCDSPRVVYNKVYKLLIEERPNAEALALKIEDILMANYYTYIRN